MSWWNQNNKTWKIIEVYDPKRHIWSNGLAGLIIKEECKNANLRDWELQMLEHM